MKEKRNNKRLMFRVFIITIIIMAFLIIGLINFNSKPTYTILENVCLEINQCQYNCDNNSTGIFAGCESYKELILNDGTVCKRAYIKTKKCTLEEVDEIESDIGTYSCNEVGCGFSTFAEPINEKFLQENPYWIDEICKCSMYKFYDKKCSESTCPIYSDICLKYSCFDKYEVGVER